MIRPLRCQYLVTAGMPTTASGVHREHLEAFLADMGDRLAAAIVAKHSRSLQQLFRWLVDDGEVDTSPMAKMRPPAVPEKPVDVLTDDELRALLAAAKGNTFENRRDTAVLRFLIDTGVRAAELIGLGLLDVDLEHAEATVLGRAVGPARCPTGPRPRTRCAATCGSGTPTRRPPQRRCGWARRDR